MSETLKFTSWQRSPVYDLVPSEVPVDGRLVGKLPLTLTDQYGPDVATGAVAFHLTAPRDIVGLASRAIVHTAPAALARDAETTKLVHVDLAEPDLPWRYTPRKAAGDRLRPWLVVLVGTTSELRSAGVTVQILQPAVFQHHDLSQSHFWAHVQDDGHTRTSRLLSPRRLQPQTEYLAAVVPAFDDAGQQAWDLSVGRTPGGLPAFYTWRFWTGEEGDFATLATRIMPRRVANLGRAPLAYRRGAVAAGLQVRGAITTLAVDPDGPPEATARADLQAFKAQVDALSAQDPIGRAVIGLPNYGRPWVVDLGATTWTATLNSDPRYRGTAGLGLWMGIEAQQDLVDAAVAQLGELSLAAKLVRELALGLLAAGSLWSRRLPTEAARQVHMLSPLMRRLRTPRGTALAAITGPTSPLEPALFSSAARRMLRPGAAQTRHTTRGFVGRRELVETANQCPPPPEATLPGLPHVEAMAAALGLPPLESPDVLDLRPFTPEIEAAMDRLVGQTIDFASPPFLDMLRALSAAIARAYEGCELHTLYLQEHAGEVATRQLLVEAVRKCLLTGGWQARRDPPNRHHLQIDPRHLRDTVGTLLPEPAPSRCVPPDLGRVAAIVAAAVDPNGPQPPAKRRVKARISGLDLTRLDPPQLPVGLDFPTWTLLRDRAKEWIVPGIDQLVKDSVVAMQTNPTFIDAYLVGLNTQFLNELHWRNLPVDRRSTPLLMFWGHVNFETGHREAEIRPFLDWPPASELGDLVHEVLHPGAPPTGQRDLVILFRTDLFRRYPNTLVYLVRPTPTVDDALKATPDFHFTAATRAARRFLGPIFQGSIARDLVFFSFDVDPDTLDQYWLVLDEPPSELRFRGVGAADAPLAGTTPRDSNGLPPAAPDADAAHFATRTIDHPTRVGIDGAYLKQLGLGL